MKSIYLLMFFVLMSLTGYAQNDLFSNIQGLSHEGNKYFDLAGTSITIISEKVKFDEKGIKKIKNKYKIKDKDILQEYDDDSINQQNLVIKSTLNKDGRSGHVVTYLLPLDNNSNIDVIQFISAQPINQQIAKEFMNAYFNNELSQYISPTQNGQTRDFHLLGRKILLGATCHYMDPNNIQCSGNGQMNWSVFDSKESAELFKKDMMSLGSKFKILSDTTVNVIFEDVQTPAIRRVYKAKGVTNFLLGGQTLCVYYITQKIRGWYVMAVLSYYMYNDSDFVLAPLLQQVMSLE